jgi:hypothetical protein
MNGPIPVLVVIAIAAALILWLRQRGGPTRNAEAQLRRICHGDDAQVERLIQGELDRARGIPRTEAAARAVARYRRDNR